MPSTEEPVAYLARLDAIQEADASRFKAFHQADQERRGIIDDIISKYTALLEDHRNLQIDYNTLRATNRSMYKENQTSKQELADIKLEKVCGSGVVGGALHMSHYDLVQPVDTESWACYIKPPLIIHPDGYPC